MLMPLFDLVKRLFLAVNHESYCPGGILKLHSIPPNGQYISTYGTIA